jgi:hypothetical protein
VALVRLARTYDAGEAEAARMALESAGIQVFLFARARRHRRACGHRWRVPAFLNEGATE